jgi:hypothetical protein
MSRGKLGTLAALAIVALVALLAGPGGSSGTRHMQPEPVRITGYPIPHFKRGEPGLTRFGPLEYIGGVELRGEHPNFGGVSAFRIRPDGETFLAVTDTGDWITGRIAYAGGKPAGITAATIGPVMGRDARGLFRAKDRGLWDIESVAVDGNRVYIGIEREHTLLAFDWTDGLRSAGRSIPLNGFLSHWPENRGIEALGILPQGSAYAGRLIGLSERSHGRDDPTEGFVMKTDGSEAFLFRLARVGGFDITDLDFLPDGDMLVTERQFSPLRGVGFQLRRVKLADIRPDALVQGEVLLTTDRSYQIDNIEAISINRRADGETIITLVSDDNFSVVQRTLLLQFRWRP